MMSEMSWYDKYLLSDAWQSTKQMALEHYGFRCAIDALHNGPFHVHHNSYESIGDEDIRDLTVLCVDCHKRVHDWDESKTK